MSRPVAGMTLGVALVVVLVLAWWLAWRPMVMLHEVGLGGWRPASGRVCEDKPKSPVRYCNGPARVAFRGLPLRESVVSDRRTGQVVEITFDQFVTDSVTLARLEDSIAAAMVGRGGTLIPCGRSSWNMRRPFGLSVWRLREQDVMVTTMPWRQIGQQSRSWIVEFSGLPPRSIECDGEERIRRRVPGRLLTTTEMMAEVYRRLMNYGEQ